MQDVVPSSPSRGRNADRPLLTRLGDYLPAGQHARRRGRGAGGTGCCSGCSCCTCRRLFVFGSCSGTRLAVIVEAVAVPLACLVIGHLVPHRRWASFFITRGLVYCSAALVRLSRGASRRTSTSSSSSASSRSTRTGCRSCWNVVFTVLSHGIGSIWLGGPDLQPPGRAAAPVAVVAHPRRRRARRLRRRGALLEEHRGRADREGALGRQLLADAEISRRQFTSDLLVNLARRNQSLLYRQLDLLNQLEDKERDPDALADLFRLDHLATRIRRNAESLLVLSGEESAADLAAAGARCATSCAPRSPRPRTSTGSSSPSTTALAVSGRSVADLTHLLAELIENAVRFSPPGDGRDVRSPAQPARRGGQLVTIEDWGVGHAARRARRGQRAAAHAAGGRPVRLAAARVPRGRPARARYGITVSLTATPGSGITAVVDPAAALLFTPDDLAGMPPAVRPQPAPGDGRTGDGRNGGAPLPQARRAAGPARRRRPRPSRSGSPLRARGHPQRRRVAAARAVRGRARPDAGPVGPVGRWRGWWNPDVHGADGAGLPTLVPTEPRPVPTGRRRRDERRSHGAGAGATSLRTAPDERQQANGGPVNGGPVNGGSTNGQRQRPPRRHGRTAAA